MNYILNMKVGYEEEYQPQRDLGMLRVNGNDLFLKTMLIFYTVDL